MENQADLQPATDLDPDILKVKNLLVELINSFIDDANALEVTTLMGSNSVHFHIKSGTPADTSKIIGKTGNNIQSIRNIFRLIGIKMKRKITLLVVD